MKRIFTGIFLFVVLIAPACATYCWLQLRKTAVKQEVAQRISEGIDKEELVLLKFTIEETQTKLRWKHAKEFEYNHQMYDIIESQIKGNTVMYWCLNDHKETNLNRQLGKLAAHAFGNETQKNEKQAWIFSYFKSLVCQANHRWQAINYETKYHYSTASIIFLSFVFSPPTPPPRHCSSSYFND